MAFRDNLTESEGPVAQGWNNTIVDFSDLTMDRNFALLLVSLTSAILWVVYITYYNSRVLGYILTRLINRFYFQDENFKIGKFYCYNNIDGYLSSCKVSDLVTRVEGLETLELFSIKSHNSIFF